jgi:hypothetical protein
MRWNAIRVRLEWLPSWLLGIIDYPPFRFSGRCLASGCGRLMALHSPWAMHTCSRTPMAIRLSEQGADRLLTAELADLPDTDWQVVPVPHARA